MKILITFILIFVLVKSYSQSVYDLDLKNGFRHIKLGSTPSQIKNIVKKKDQMAKFPNYIMYDYVGGDITYVAGIKVNSIDLSFFRNKLHSIGINFGSADISKDFELYEFNSIFNWLEIIYGKEWHEAENSDGVIINGAIWDGAKVRLELLRIDLSKSQSDPQEGNIVGGYILVIDKKLNGELYLSDF